MVGLLKEIALRRNKHHSQPHKGNYKVPAPFRMILHSYRLLILRRLSLNELDRMLLLILR